MSGLSTKADQKQTVNQSARAGASALDGQDPRAYWSKGGEGYNLVNSPTTAVGTTGLAVAGGFDGDLNKLDPDVKQQYMLYNPDAVTKGADPNANLGNTPGAAPSFNNATQTQTGASTEVGAMADARRAPRRAPGATAARRGNLGTSAVVTG